MFIEDVSFLTERGILAIKESKTGHRQKKPTLGGNGPDRGIASLTKLKTLVILMVYGMGSFACVVQW